MKIGIDARPFRKKRVGIGNYVCGLTQLLPEIASGHDYFLYSNKEIDPAFNNISFHRRSERSFRVLPGTFWLWGRGRGFASRDCLDIFWSTNPVLPFAMPPSVLQVVTVYDLVWRLFPETMSRHGLWFQRLFAESAIRRADLIVTISESTAADLTRTLGIAPDKIKLVYPGISEVFGPRNRSEAAGYVAQKYKISKRYMAAVGTVEPRKNLVLLPKVLRVLKDKGQLDCQLVVAGDSGWKSSDLFRKIRDEGLTEKEIHFLGYVPQEDLPLFYSGAQLFLFPSLYEGFGFPPLEAMACGTPVVSSNARCMPEVLGEGALLQSPQDAGGFAAAINKVLSDENVRRSLSTTGLRQARKFRWETSAKQLLEVFEGAVSEQKQEVRERRANDVLNHTDKVLG